MPNLNVMTLNVGRLLQERTREYLQRLASGDEARLDVLCIQDIAERDLSLLTAGFPHQAYAAMTIHVLGGERASVGVAIVSRYPMVDVKPHTTWGDGTLKHLQGVNDQGQRIAPTVENDRRIEATEDRVVICATVLKDGIKFNIATTHGFWVRGGISNEMQYQSTHRLMSFLSDEAAIRNGLVLAADMNFGRGSEMYNTFVEKKGPDNKGFYDCVPLDIESTLDPDHPIMKKGIKVVSDYFMTREGYGGDFVSDPLYSVKDVRLRSGVSDHCAVSATITLDW